MIRWCAGVTLALGAVWGLRWQLGPLLATVVIAPAVWIAIARGGRILDRKVFDTPTPPLPPRRGRVIDVPSRPTRGVGACTQDQ